MMHQPTQSPGLDYLIGFELSPSGSIKHKYGTPYFEIFPVNKFIVLVHTILSLNLIGSLF